MDQPQGLKNFVQLWRHKLRLAAEDRRKRFDKDAEIAKKYYLGPHNFIYSESGAKSMLGFTYSGAGEDNFQPPIFQMTFNKVSEMVQLFGPLLYHKNPVRTVTARQHWKPPDFILQLPPSQTSFPGMESAAGILQPGEGMGMAPGMGMPPGTAMPPPTSSLAQQLAAFSQASNPALVQQIELENALAKAKAELLSNYLNYTPNELDLKSEMRLAIDESLVKGRGCMWTEFYQSPGNTQAKMIGSFFETVDNLLIDPDMPQMRDAKWIARKRILPVWEIEKKYQLPPGLIKGSMETTDTIAGIEAGPLSAEKKKGETADLAVIWEIWSRMGMGVRLRPGQANLALGDAEKITEAFGDYVYLVLCEKCDWPLNLPAEIVEAALTLDQENPQLQAQAMEALAPFVQWPIPFWQDDEWPVTPIDLHPLFDSPWPMNHLKPALGEQNFLDWAYSFLASKVKNTSRDFIAVLKSAGEEIREQIERGGDLSILELDATNKSVSELIQFFQHPPMNQDLTNIVQMVERNFEKRTGMTEGMYGQSAAAYRSAAEAGLKGQMMQIRPDDMAERVEHAAGLIARKEAIAARMFLTGQDVLAIVGSYGAQFWDQQIRTNDYDAINREFDYRIEAQSARKPNREAEIGNTDSGAQFLMPILQQIAQQFGIWGPLNAFMRDWAKARGYTVEDYLVDPTLLQQQQQQQMQPVPPEQQPPPLP